MITKQKDGSKASEGGRRLQIAVDTRLWANGNVVLRGWQLRSQSLDICLASDCVPLYLFIGECPDLSRSFSEVRRIDDPPRPIGFLERATCNSSRSKAHKQFRLEAERISEFLAQLDTAPNMPPLSIQPIKEDLHVVRRSRSSRDRRHDGV